jgi:hypothetical protein
MDNDENYTVDEWQNHPRLEPSAMSELAGHAFTGKISGWKKYDHVFTPKEIIKEANKYSIDYPKGTMNQDGTVALKKETINGFKKWANEKFNKKKSIIQKIRDYDRDIDVLERQVTMFDELADTNKKAYDMACEKNNELCARVESAESMRDHYKRLFEDLSRALGRQSSVIAEKSRDLELMTKVADNWQSRLIDANILIDSYREEEARSMIGRRLKFSVGHNHVEIVVGNPVTACKLFNEVDSLYFDSFSLCNKKDQYNWKKGAIQSLTNLMDNWFVPNEINRAEWFKAMFKKYPELK